MCSTFYTTKAAVSFDVAKLHFFYHLNGFGKTRVKQKSVTNLHFTLMCTFDATKLNSSATEFINAHQAKSNISETPVRVSSLVTELKQSTKRLKRILIFN